MVQHKGEWFNESAIFMKLCVCKREIEVLLLSTKDHNIFVRHMSKIKYIHRCTPYITPS